MHKKARDAWQLGDDVVRDSDVDRRSYAPGWRSCIGHRVIGARFPVSIFDVGMGWRSLSVAGGGSSGGPGTTQKVRLGRSPHTLRYR
jgi:hypothetical protein